MNVNMNSLSNRIMQHAEAQPESTPLCPDTLGDLGNAHEVAEALEHLTASDRLLHVCQDVYMRPIDTRFGRCAPRVGKAIQALSNLWEETIVRCGGAAANCLGLTTQNPLREVFLTSGPSRQLHFGAYVVELHEAPAWQLVAPRRKAGDVIRALAWLGPAEVEDGLAALLPTLSKADRQELAAIPTTTMPGWLAQPVAACLARA